MSDNLRLSKKYEDATSIQYNCLAFKLDKGQAQESIHEFTNSFIQQTGLYFLFFKSIKDKWKAKPWNIMRAPFEIK